ncbi:hypothetical protein ACWDA3_23635 [Nonomuraea rubra]
MTNERDKYRYCKIFTTAPEAYLKTQLAILLGGEFDRHAMDLADLVVEVRRNPDAHIDTTAVAEFLSWPFLIELEEENGATSAMVESVSAIIRTLWAAGHKAVAASDFEDELPWKGGIELGT